MKVSGLICVHLWLIFFLPVAAQVRPVYDRGATGLLQILKRLNTSASVLMIGAHPDDEDTALLAYLARGESARTAYLSLTRGDGGQNIIGPELGEALGVIRTEELLQARRLDGAEQFFTRAYDFGFSKTLVETRAKWDEKIILCDTVRVIRNFRPLVVVSQFSGTPADGHGHHQFAGYISPLAVKAAADATQCKDAGEVWQVKKFYVRHRGTGEPTLRINTGKYDAVLGRSYFEIAMEARSQHKSQEQGVLELKGNQVSALKLVGADTAEKSIFDGLDISSSSSARVAAADALREFDVKDIGKILPHLVRGYSTAETGYSKDLFARAISLAAGFQVDALADRETIAGGENAIVSVKAFINNKSAVKVLGSKIVGPEEWRVTAAEPPSEPAQGFFRRETGDYAAYFNVTAPANAIPTQPYWLADQRQGDMFGRRDAALTQPFQDATLRAEVVIEVEGVPVKYDVPVEYRFADDVRGEIRRNVDVVPALTLSVDQPMLIVPQSDKPQNRRIAVSVSNNSSKPVTGIAGVNIRAQPEWRHATLPNTVSLKNRGEKTTFSIDVTIPAKTKAGLYNIYPNVMVGETVATQSMQVLTYPHIQTHRIYRRAAVAVRVIDLKTSPVKIGYITGSGDRVQDAIRQMGFNVETISENELASGDLSKYDTIVVGIRAFQVRPDVVANNARLLDFARNGGTLVVQYQLPPYGQTHAPFAVQQGPRVVDENAAVTLLDAKHPIFNLPNKITPADFEGWVQERNLYNFTNMPAEYTGLLESHDAGEAENKGGLVIAKLGKGNYVYCSYSMFRQLPAGVPGAYRLFANILGVGSRHVSKGSAK